MLCGEDAHCDKTESHALYGQDAGMTMLNPFLCVESGILTIPHMISNNVIHNINKLVAMNMGWLTSYVSTFL